LCFKIVVFGNIRDTDDEHSHATTGPMDDPGWDVHQRPFEHRVFHAVQNDGSRPFEHIVQLGGTLVKMEFGAVNVHSMGPSCRG